VQRQCKGMGTGCMKSHFEVLLHDHWRINGNGIKLVSRRIDSWSRPITTTIMEIHALHYRRWCDQWLSSCILGEEGEGQSPFIREVRRQSCMYCLQWLHFLHKSLNFNLTQQFQSVIFCFTCHEKEATLLTITVNLDKNSLVVVMSH